MNDVDPVHDDFLAAQFRRAHPTVAPEPFVRAVRARVAAAGSRARARRLALRGVGVVALVFASPWLIEGSRRLSQPFEEGLATVATWLLSPVGAATAVGIALVAVAAMRLRRLH